MFTFPNMFRCTCPVALTWPKWLLLQVTGFVRGLADNPAGMLDAIKGGMNITMFHGPHREWRCGQFRPTDYSGASSVATTPAGVSS